MVARGARANATWTNYDTNKQRAKKYAHLEKKSITYAFAKDTPSTQALRLRPDLLAQKREWLKRHDRECGDLYGALPLILGMRVALTDHIDRNLAKQLLRGRVGTIHSWILNKDEDSGWQNGQRPLKKLPRVVFVKFLDAEGKELPWRLRGLPENGLYPIVPRKRTWYLDKSRKYPELEISRHQLQLAPAYAITSHASQDQTLEDGAIVDLRTGKGTSPISSYVAMARVKSRNKLLIYRPFEREFFTQGGAEGPELLMKKLRGDAIDWKTIIS